MNSCCQYLVLPDWRRQHLLCPENGFNPSAQVLSGNPDVQHLGVRRGGRFNSRGRECSFKGLLKSVARLPVSSQGYSPSVLGRLENAHSPWHEPLDTFVLHLKFLSPAGGRRRRLGRILEIWTLPVTPCVTLRKGLTLSEPISLSAA